MIGSRLKMFVASLAGSALLLSPMTSVTAEPAAVGGCSPNTLKYKVSVASVNTGAARLVDVSETSLVFTQGGTRASCVIISFSALAQAFPEGTSMVIEAFVDADPCEPRSNIFTSSPHPTTNARTFVCPNVAPGAHTVQIKYRTAGGGTVFMHGRTTILHHLR